MQRTNWVEIFGAYKTDKGLVFLIYKDFLYINKETRNLNRKKGKRFDQEVWRAYEKILNLRSKQVKGNQVKNLLIIVITNIY